MGFIAGQLKVLLFQMMQKGERIGIAELAAASMDVGAGLRGAFIVKDSSMFQPQLAVESPGKSAPWGRTYRQPVAWG